MTLSPTAARVRADLIIPYPPWRQPVVIGIFGLPCTGKTEIARHLAERHRLVQLSADALRQQYGVSSDVDAVEVMREVASQLLRQHVSVIFDGVHPQKAEREVARWFAIQHGAVYEQLYATADASVIQERLHLRASQPFDTTLGWRYITPPDEYERAAATFETPLPDEYVQQVRMNPPRDSFPSQLVNLERRLRARM